MLIAIKHSVIFFLLIALATPLHAEDEGYAPPPAEPLPVEGQMDPALGSQLLYPPQSAEGSAAMSMVFSTAASIFKTRVPRLPRKVAAAPAPSPAPNLPADFAATDDNEAAESEPAPVAANAPVADRGLLSQVETDEAKRAASEPAPSTNSGASGRLLQAVKRNVPR